MFGGTVTALAGIVAKRVGPETGGLFLVFPSIFPAAATLIEKHEKQNKNVPVRTVRNVVEQLPELMPPAQRWEASGLPHSL